MDIANREASLDNPHAEKRASQLLPPACFYPNSLNMTLDNGIMKDNLGRQAYIASNFQFQFDAPPQAGALATAGFSVCGNGSVALGNQVIWWSCLTGGFSNLYNQSIGGQCSEALFEAVPLKYC